MTNLSKDRSGAAAVEFALVGPLFAYLMMGLTVYGVWLWMAQGVQSLAAEGARAAVAGLDDIERRALAQEAVLQGAASIPALKVEAVRIDIQTDDSEVRVAVAYPASEHPLMALTALVPAPPDVIRRTAAVRTGGY